MPIELQIIHAREFIRLGAHGHFDLEASKSVLAQLAAACWKRGINQALLDVRALHPGVKPVFTPKDLVTLVNTFREVGFTHQQRLAVLYAADPHRRARLFASIAKQHGWSVQAFDGFEEAIIWLAGAGPESSEVEIEHTPRAKKVQVRKRKIMKTSAKPAVQPTIQIKSSTGPRRDTAKFKSPKRQTASARATLAIMAFAVMAALARQTTEAQPVVPPQAIAQFQHVVGSRVEAVTILGGDYGAAGGIYTFRGGEVANLSVAKAGGGGIVAEPRPLGESGVSWAPVIQGNLGHLSAQNGFATGYLQGNQSVYDVLAVQVGGGARFFFTDNFSVATTVSGIYGHTENEFKPRNVVGDYVKSVASGTYVDWNLDTWTAEPSLELNYDFHWRRTTFEFGSRYNYFHTESFNSSSPVIGVNGNSHTWENKLDVDVPLGWKLFDRELHTGGFFSRTELFGNAAEGLNENHIYTVNGRIVMDLLGKAWKIRWLGVGYSYFWGDHFAGWSAGLDMKFKF